MAHDVIITSAVEGIADEAVVRKLVAHLGAEVGTVYGNRGKSHLKSKIAGYANAARHTPWLVLVDLDQDAECAAPLREEWIPQQPALLCFRVAVRALEAWLLADVEAIAGFLRVARSKIPADPESLDNPKVALINIARGSRNKDIRADMVPRAGSQRTVGPAYTSRIVEFVSSDWRPMTAAKRADSLDRTLESIRALIAKCEE